MRTACGAKSCTTSRIAHRCTPASSVRPPTSSPVPVYRSVPGPTTRSSGDDANASEFSVSVPPSGTTWRTVDSTLTTRSARPSDETVASAAVMFAESAAESVERAASCARTALFATGTSKTGYVPQATMPSMRIARLAAPTTAKSERATIGVKPDAATWTPMDVFAPSVPSVIVRTICERFVTRSVPSVTTRSVSMGNAPSPSNARAPRSRRVGPAYICTAANTLVAVADCPRTTTPPTDETSGRATTDAPWAAGSRTSPLGPISAVTAALSSSRTFRPMLRPRTVAPSNRQAILPQRHSISSIESVPPFETSTEIRPAAFAMRASER